MKQMIILSNFLFLHYFYFQNLNLILKLTYFCVKVIFLYTIIVKGLLTSKTFLCSFNKHIPRAYHNSEIVVPIVYGALSLSSKISLSTSDKLIYVSLNMS